MSALAKQSPGDESNWEQAFHLLKVGSGSTKLPKKDCSACDVNGRRFGELDDCESKA